jgi:hypothetical protein
MPVSDICFFVVSVILADWRDIASSLDKESRLTEDTVAQWSHSFWRDDNPTVWPILRLVATIAGRRFIVPVTRSLLRLHSSNFVLFSSLLFGNAITMRGVGELFSSTAGNELRPMALDVCSSTTLATIIEDIHDGTKSP